MEQVTDPNLLRALQSDAPPSTPGAQVTDPAALAALDAGSKWRDLGRFGMTAGVRGLGSFVDNIQDPLSALRRLISPGFEDIEQTGRFHPGQAVGDAAFSVTGVPEYQPKTPEQKQALTTATGLISGAPFGPVGAGIGAAGGLASELARQYIAPYFNLSPSNTERVATAASLAPGVGVAAAPRARPPVPNATELKGTALAAKDRWLGSPIEMDPNSVADVARDVQADLVRRGPRPSRVPETSEILKDIANPPTPPPGGRTVLTPDDITNIREQLQETIQTNSRSIDPKSSREVVAAARALQQLDSYIANLGQNPAALVAGSPEAAAAAARDFAKFRGDYAQSQKSNEITGELTRYRSGIAERADARAQAANSGQNIDNSIRSRVESFLENRRAALGLTDAEFAALDRVVQGGPVQNLLRTWSNRINSPGAQAGAAGAGATIGGPTGAAIGFALPGPLSGIAKSFENALARRSLDQANTSILMNSPEFQQRLAQMPPRDAAIAQAILPGLLAPPR